MIFIAALSISGQNIRQEFNNKTAEICSTMIPLIWTQADLARQSSKPCPSVRAKVHALNCQSYHDHLTTKRDKRLDAFTLTLRIRRFHVADDGPPTVIYMNVLDTKVLMPAMTQAAKNLDLGRIGSQQTSRRRPERRNSPLRCESDFHLGQNRHGAYVRAGHLDSERSLNFILRRGGFNHGESGIQFDFRNAPKRGASDALQLEQGGVDKIARRCAEGLIQPLPPNLVFTIRGIDFCEARVDAP